MLIFLSYAAEDREIADQTRLALTGAGHRVFFDRSSLPAGGDYHARIRSAVDESDFIVFLISPHSIVPGTYALTELKYARIKWPHPKGRVLPVRIADVPWEQVPVYLKAVTVLEPEGSIAAEVVAAVSVMVRDIPLQDTSRADQPANGNPARRWPSWKIALPVVAVTLVALVSVGMMFWNRQMSSESPNPTAARGQQPLTRVELVETVQKALGRVQVDGKTNDGRDWTSGTSGFFISTAGHFVTVADAFPEVQGANLVIRIMPDRSDIATTAVVLGIDRSTDLAVLQAAKSDGSLLSFATERVAPGMDVTIVGYSESTITTVAGPVSNVEPEQILVSAVVTPGFGGAPVVNNNGEVVGIVTGMLTNSPMTVALPASLAVRGLLRFSVTAQLGRILLNPDYSREAALR